MVSTQPHVSVRRAELADCERIARVHVDAPRTTYQGIVPQSYLDDRSYPVRVGQWKNMLSKGNLEECNFVAQDSAGAIIGFARGGPEREPASGYAGELYAIYVLDEWHKRGIGRLLINAAADDLLLHGWSSMRVWVLAANPACGFYERLGGKVVAEKELTLGEACLPEIAYGWPDTMCFGREIHE
jgi:GNAT superfamily N-acetyltransferase